jgi:hypothetical protein
MHRMEEAAKARLALVEAGCDSATLDRLLEDYCAALRAADWAKRFRADFKRKAAASSSTLRRLKTAYRSISKRILPDAHRLGIPADSPLTKIPVWRSLNYDGETESSAATEPCWVQIASVPELISALGDLYDKQVKFNLRQYGSPQQDFVVEQESRLINYLRAATSHPHFEEAAVLFEEAAGSALDPPKTPRAKVYYTKSVKARYERLKQRPRKNSDKGMLASYLG